MILWPPHTFRQANKLGEIRKKDPKLGAKRNTEEMYKPNHSTYTAERFLLLLLTASNIESHVIYIEPFSYIRTFHIGSKELRSIGHNNHLYLSATCKLKADLSFFFFSLSLWTPACHIGHYFLYVWCQSLSLWCCCNMGTTYLLCLYIKAALIITITHSKIMQHVCQTVYFSTNHFDRDDQEGHRM